MPDREVQRKQILDSLIATTSRLIRCGGLISLVLRTRQQVVELLGRARAELATEQVWVRARRRQRWFEWCNDQLANGSAKLFKWVRDGSRVVVAPLWTPPVGEDQPGYGAHLKAIRKAWAALWAPSRGSLITSFAGWLQELEGLPELPGAP